MSIMHDSALRVVSTDRLMLREFCDSDVEAMLAIFGDPDVMRFGDGPQPAGWIRSWIERNISNYVLLGYGLWAIVSRNSATPIGYCGLTRFDDINGQPDSWL